MYLRMMGIHVEEEGLGFFGGKEKQQFAVLFWFFFSGSLWFYLCASPVSVKPLIIRPE